MRVFFDTSVLVAAMVESHPMHTRSLIWLRRARSGEIGFLVAGHTVAELYSVLTTLPARPRISPRVAREMIESNIESSAEIVGLTPSDYKLTIDRMAELGLAGGAVYDALIARAAMKSAADRLLTLDVGDFERVWPESKKVLSLP